MPPKRFTIKKYGLLRFAKILSNDFSPELIGFALAFTEMLDSYNNAQNCTYVDRFLCLLWTASFKFYKIQSIKTTREKKFEEQNIKKINDVISEIKNNWLNKDKYNDNNQILFEKTDFAKTKIWSLKNSNLVNKNIANNDFDFFRYYYKLSNEQYIFPFTQDKTFPKTNNESGFQKSELSKNLFDWILIPQIVILKAINICVSIKERNLIENIIPKLPHFNFFPQLNDDEENFLNECTVSIFNNGNGIDKWNIFCTSNQVLTLYLTQI